MARLTQNVPPYLRAYLNVPNRLMGISRASLDAFWSRGSIIKQVSCRRCGSKPASIDTLRYHHFHPFSFMCFFGHYFIKAARLSFLQESQMSPRWETKLRPHKTGKPIDSLKRPIPRCASVTSAISRHLQLQARLFFKPRHKVGISMKRRVFPKGV
jgi:hypothetical protein